MVGLFALLPAVVDAVKVPVIAAGGIADSRGVAAALLLGACAVQIGTGFLAAPKRSCLRPGPTRWPRAAPEETLVTRAFSGRAGRSIATAYCPRRGRTRTRQARALPRATRIDASDARGGGQIGDIATMQAWAGQSAARAPAKPAAEIARQLWEGARALLTGV